MCRWTRGLALTFLLAAVAVTGCSDSSGTSTLLPTSPDRFASPYPDIDQEIVDLFPTGLETAAGVRWVNVTNKLSAGDHVTAESMFWELVDWMLKKSGRLTDPTGPLNQLQGLNKLIGDMYAVVFPGRPRPPATLNGDATVGLVLPGSDAIVVTPLHRAGVALLAGSVAQPTLVVIDQNPTTFGTHCAGPLRTTLCQYPLFYRFEEFPHARLLKPARFAVCHVNSGPFAPPEGIHDRFRLAHDAPGVEPPFGTVVEGIEILKLVDVHDFMICSDVSYQVASSSRNPLIRGTLAAVNGVLGAIQWAFTPERAYAIDQGGGGEGIDFSNFNVVDPVRPVGIDFETFPGGASTSPTCDTACDLSTQYANAGVTFDFQATAGAAPAGHASLLRNSFDPAGTFTHQVAHAKSDGVFLDGTLIMRYANATTVTFVLRTPGPTPVAVNAFGPLPIEGEPQPIPASQISRVVTDSFPPTCDNINCALFHQETITVSNASGISRIEIAGGAVHVFVDDMTIVSPPPAPIP